MFSFKIFFGIERYITEGPQIQIEVIITGSHFVQGDIKVFDKSANNS